MSYYSRESRINKNVIKINDNYVFFPFFAIVYFKVAMQYGHMTHIIHAMDACQLTTTLLLSQTNQEMNWMYNYAH